MSKLTLKDVAHYYINSKIEVMGDDGVLFPFHAGVIYGYFGTYTPILRHRKDITEEDARKIYKAFSGEEFTPFWSYKNAMTWFKFAFEGVVEDDPDRYPPSVTHCLIGLGIDIFELIESGEAIRKEVENG